MVDLDPKRLMALNRPLPRYTSYPTAPEWQPLAAQDYHAALETFGASERPLSLYLHIPFCKTMCLYCACSVVLNRRPEREERYVASLAREIDLVADAIGRKSLVRQLHFGGGTPTQLSESLLERVMQKLKSRFEVDPTGEIAMEIDPRTVVEDGGRKLRALRAMGFNRVSFGVQDTNVQVQSAVKRHQSYTMTRETYDRARGLGFNEINIDLIYGLPFQSRESFRETAKLICAMRPDRVALFSYAKVPWLKPHQKAIKDETLPTTEEKFGIYCQARAQFLEAGYTQIGMDHFALPHDRLSIAFRNRELQRNFQGYSLKLTEDLVGLGLTATGLVSDTYVQNQKSLDVYYECVDKGLLPVLRGKVLTEDDKMRKWVIHRLMSDFQLNKREFQQLFGRSFDETFAHEEPALQKLVDEGLLKPSDETLEPTLYGSLLIRNVASVFDAYLKRDDTHRRFSRAI